jgi:hypothetical protein
MSSDQPDTTFNQDETRAKLVQLLLVAQGSVARHLALMPKNGTASRSTAWQAYQKDLALASTLTDALEAYS